VFNKSWATDYLFPTRQQLFQSVMRRSGIRTAYTIAWAAFYPVTITFAGAIILFTIALSMISGTHIERMNKTTQVRQFQHTL